MSSRVPQTPITPPRGPPALKALAPKKVMTTWSRLFQGEVFAKFGVGSPVLEWPKSFREAERMILEEEEEQPAAKKAKRS